MALREEIKKRSGVDAALCYQCGTCSSGCPILTMMDVGPRKIMRMVTENDEAVLSTSTIWLCAACYTCDTRCPRGLKISAVMESLRLMTLRKNIDHIRPETLTPQTHKELPPITLIAAMRKYTS